MIGKPERSPAAGAAALASAASDPIALFARWEAQSRGESITVDEQEGLSANPASAALTAATSTADGADPLCAALLPAITTTVEAVFPDGQIAIQDASVAEDTVVVQVTFRSSAAGDERTAEPTGPHSTAVSRPAAPDRPHRWVEGTSDVVAAG